MSENQNDPDKIIDLAIEGLKAELKAKHEPADPEPASERKDPWLNPSDPARAQALRRKIQEGLPATNARLIMQWISNGYLILEKYDSVKLNKQRILYRDETAKLKEQINKRIVKWQARLEAKDPYFQGIKATCNLEIDNPFFLFKDDTISGGRSTKPRTVLIEGLYQALLSKEESKPVITWIEADHLVAEIMQVLFHDPPLKRDPNNKYYMENLRKISERYFRDHLPKS